MATTMKTRSLLGALLLCLPLAAAAQAPGGAKSAPAAKPAMPANHPPIGGAPAKSAPSPWGEFADYAITVKTPPKGDTGTWKIRAYANPADVLIELDTPAAKGRTRGSIMLVGGSALATRGFTPEPGFELDPLDVAVLNLKILTRLLDLALPAGPSALKGKQSVNAKDERSPVFASTPSATAKFDAPWSLKGTLERKGAAGVAFQLEIEAPALDKTGTRARWAFSGTASGAARDRVLDDAMKLDGWTPYRLGPAKSAKSGHTVLQFGATRLPGPFATLKELRAAL